MKKSKHFQTYQNTKINVCITKTAEKKAKKLFVWKKFQQKIELFKNNPKHPSLHSEKLEPKDQNRWSIRIDKQYRAVLVKTGENTITIYYIGDYH